MLLSSYKSAQKRYRGKSGSGVSGGEFMMAIYFVYCL